MTLAKLRKEEEVENEVHYKYFTGREIKSMIQLDSWMYTLSNEFSTDDSEEW